MSFTVNLVSIHAPREGCDSNTRTKTDLDKVFQFTHPGRGATIIGHVLFGDITVSIHAPREGCDVLWML